LVPHDVAEEVYLAFEVGSSVKCAEGLSFETYQFSMNYIPITVSYTRTYDYPPDLFGTVGTSLLMLAEDQCEW
jgi:hypothetical protein